MRPGSMRNGDGKPRGSSTLDCRFAARLQGGARSSVACVLLLAALPGAARAEEPRPNPREVRLANLRRLTRTGSNAEAYFSFDGSRLIFQSTRRPYRCDQIFVMGADGSGLELVSTGKGRTTCGYFFPDGRRVLFSSTHAASPACPPPPDRSKGYAWGLHPTYDVYVRDLGTGRLHRLTDNPGYDAEATLSSDGRRVVFTSYRGGRLHIYTMRSDGSALTRITHRVGYVGGPFFSPDGKQIVYRAWYPTDPAARGRLLADLAQHVVRPRGMELEIFVCNADGTGHRRVTSTGRVNFAPSFHPDGKRIVFSSNLHMKSGAGRSYNLFLIGVDGKGLERLTYSPGFDCFPMFSPDGKRLVWSSNRGNASPRRIDVLVADWVERK